MFKEVSKEEAAVKAVQGEDSIMIWKDDQDMRFMDLKEEISGIFDVKGARFLIDVKEEGPKEEALPQPETPPPTDKDRDRISPAQSREEGSRKRSMLESFEPYIWPAGARQRSRTR